MNDTATAEPTTAEAPAVAAPEPFNREPYDADEAYNAEVRPLVTELAAVCAKHGMPMFLSVETAGDGEHTTEGYLTCQNHTRPGCGHYDPMLAIARGDYLAAFGKLARLGR